MKRTDHEKPFRISRRIVYEAWKRIKSNGGGPGVDEQSLEDFECKLKSNLYKIWNRMSSGSYHPPAVKVVSIPKASGGTRELGIPTVADRVAQMVVKMLLEPEIDPCFHEDSYGYRPEKSAHDALARVRQRCWKMDWVIDLDIKGFFDNIPHDLMLKAVRTHTKEPWVILYIERWLKAPAGRGCKETLRNKGTPQGGVISPLLANLFLHYAFDMWMQRENGAFPFERYADDVIVHCNNREEAQGLLGCITARLNVCGLQVNQRKTKVVYCKDANRQMDVESFKFTFLGYEFRPRIAYNNRGKRFVSFQPAICPEAAKVIRAEMRGWHLQRRSDKSLEDLARMFDSKLRGWVNYYGRFYRSALNDVFRTLDRAIVRWACRKYKRLRGHKSRAYDWLCHLKEVAPNLWAHWWMLGVRCK